jgi:O-acetyl-ADP-ribose deacetylase (regulator of RNase III)
MTTVVVGDARLELTIGNIAHQQDIDAVVNAANAELLSGGGVAGALHRAAGPLLAEAGRPFAPLRPGEAVITPAFDLPNRYVIHCLGPVYGSDEPADALLASCYRSALRLAENARCASIAFPALSTGAFRFPMRPAASTALRTILDALPKLIAVRLVRFVLIDHVTLALHAEVLKDLLETGSRDRAPE